MDFDKDDNICMAFVCAASNLRSYIFGIDNTSLHDCKGIAGNIIPAIATTNAIVAGIQVLECIKILKIGKEWSENPSEVRAMRDAEKEKGEEVEGILTKCKFTWCTREKTRKGVFLLPTALEKPNPKCFVCRNAMLSLSIDTKTWTFKRLLNEVFKGRLSFSSTIVQLGYDQIYEEDEEEYEQNLNKLLCDLPAGGIKHGTQITVEDLLQNLEVFINVFHREEWDNEKEPDGFIIGDDAPEVRKEEEEEGGNKENGKRKREEKVNVEVIDLDNIT